MGVGQGTASERSSCDSCWCYRPPSASALGHSVHEAKADAERRRCRYVAARRPGRAEPVRRDRHRELPTAPASGSATTRSTSTASTSEPPRPQRQRHLDHHRRRRRPIQKSYDVSPSRHNDTAHHPPSRRHRHHITAAPPTASSPRQININTPPGHPHRFRSRRRTTTSRAEPVRRDRHRRTPNVASLWVGTLDRRAPLPRRGPFRPQRRRHLDHHRRRRRPTREELRRLAKSSPTTPHKPSKPPATPTPHSPRHLRRLLTAPRSTSTPHRAHPHRFRSRRRTTTRSCRARST